MRECTRPAALLLHRTADGRRHFDLLLSIAPHPDAEARCALCWRSGLRIDQLLPGASAVLEPLERHRGRYLELDGPLRLDDRRGEVEPIARGRWEPVDAETILLLWSPHAAPWTVAFDQDEEPLDPRDADGLARALRIRRRN